MCEKAQAEGFAAAFFHGSMKMEAKKAVIQRFKAGEIRTVFATSAFGMGIDIPDIRGVIHYRPPESVEQYYQQIGRVGRDGKPSWALLYYSDKNIAFRRAQFIDKSFPDAEEIRNAFQKMTEGTGTIKTFNYFQEEDAQSAYHYLLRSDTIDVVCKGVSSLDVYEKRGTIALPEFDRYLAASPAKLLVRAASRSNTPIPQLIQAIYRWQAEGKIEATRSPAKCLVIEQKMTELPEPLMEQILTDVAEKKQYRHSQLDEMIDLLNGFTNSINLHQAIGRYLGIDEFQLGRIHETTAHIMVRSKSEVIIANLLTAHGVNFAYEETLTAGGKWFSPDFTIQRQDKTYYWEHLGMLDQEEYRLNWAIKQTWYATYFPGQLITTEESSTLSPTVERIIRQNLS